MSVEHATQVAFLRDQLNEEHQKREQAQQEFQRGQNNMQEKIQ